ncbi:phosphoribosylanthranilate isomerase [Endobacter medicaginis]|uniref:N-(5'-phosphoribosyl)anthranilate isomerase n=2 Tax=Endobacter medicaginis TaxID=1181271 RepID=A0A839UR02_9PROT|nr:phosphoribosylanthranilate isomerase [Endobacter medicaginis]MBB3172236.1 phosphoribosylanthranilate isomerase [Endobacter medicaginis]MCX5474644.1 phosphoribosylanthranilate isomerase [Endobacter medicaginis]
MAVAVKICGLSDAAGIEAARGADWIGFVFHPASPRAVSPAQVRRLLDDAPGHPPAIGLFVRPDEAMVAEALDTVRLDGLQLYTDAGTAARLGHRFGLPVWLALGVGARADLPQHAPPGIGRLLVEAKPPPGARLPGGNATAFDHRLTQGWAAPLPWLLAGGLTPGNVAGAIGESGAEAVDVSSGVEHSPGRKDPGLIDAFIRAARSASVMRS